ncbi:MAG: penicillin-binding transpeptidase domain-containing protein, partial [Kibdelosporangium sp.]
AAGAAVVVLEARSGEVYALVADEDKPFEPGPAVKIVATAAEIEDTREAGPDRYAELLRSFGLGDRTGIGLPGENPGAVPDRRTWSGPVFDQLRQGKGLAVTVLQLAGVYQAVANGGVRTPPRIVKDVPGPEGVRVISERTADAVRDTLKLPRSLPGYQIAGVAGGHTFAGILPAGDPRFVIGIALNPGERTDPLFHDIASYLAQRFRIPAAAQP